MVFDTPGKTSGIFDTDVLLFPLGRPRRRDSGLRPHVVLKKCARSLEKTRLEERPTPQFLRYGIVSP